MFIDRLTAVEVSDGVVLTRAMPVEDTASRATAKTMIDCALARVARPHTPASPIAGAILGALGMQHLSAAGLKGPENRPLLLLLGSSSQIGCRTCSRRLGSPNGPDPLQLALLLGSGIVGCNTLSSSSLGLFGLHSGSSLGLLGLRGSSHTGQGCYCDRAVADAPEVALTTAVAWAVGAAGSSVVGAAASWAVLLLGQPGNRHDVDI